MADDKKFEVRRWDFLKGWLVIKKGLTEKQAQMVTQENRSNGVACGYNTKAWYDERK